MGARLLVRDPRKRTQQLGILFGSCYAPVSSAPVAEWDAYYADMQQLLGHCRSGDVVVISTDGNASIGRGQLSGSNTDERSTSVGPYGFNHINTSGRRLRSFLEVNALAALASFFRKPYYGTWQHPASRLMHQLDHMVVSRSAVFRFTDAGSVSGQLIDSDHRATGCKLRIALNQHKKAPPSRRAELQRLDYSSLRGADAWRERRGFGDAVLQRLGLPAAPPPPPPPPPAATTATTTTDATAAPPGNPFMTDAAYATIRAEFTARHGDKWWDMAGIFHTFDSVCRHQQLSNWRHQQLHFASSAQVSDQTQIDNMRPSLIHLNPEPPTPPPLDDDREDTWDIVEAEYASVLSAWVTEQQISQLDYPTLAEALNAVALSTLEEKGFPPPPWFLAKEPELRARILARNAALDALHRQPHSSSCRDLLRDERAKVKATVSSAKSEWILDKCGKLNDGIADNKGSKDAWGNVKLLRAGLHPPRRAAPTKMKKADGSTAETPEENAEVFAASFEKLYGCAPSVDSSVLDALPQRPEMTDLDHVPTDKEIRRALGKLHHTAPGESGLPAAIWKALGETAESFALVRQIVITFWTSEELPDELELGLLSILFKKGSRSDPNNYRGIMMLEVAYKIHANIIHARLQPIIESLDHEQQCGFRSARGCFDGIFTIKQLINKRREHGQETWMLFIDLVKAFDKVPRCAKKTFSRDENDPAEAAKDETLGMLWRVMLKFGVPTKIVRLLINMHKMVHVKFDVDGVTKTIESIVGVKQGDLLGPDLFTFYIAAIMITWRSEHQYETCVVRSRPDFKMTGRRHTTGSAADELAIIDSEYADDTGLPFTSRKDVEEQSPLLCAHFKRWGMEIHAGIVEPRKESKTEILFCAAPRRCYSDAATFDGTDLSDVLLPGGRFFNIVSVFKYLGSYISRTGSDLPDIDSRVESAGKAFGTLSACLFRQTAISAQAKHAVYTGEILAILLYGSECWLLTEEIIRRLRCFHARCVRVMCGVSRVDSWRQRLSTAQLEQRFGLEPIEAYVFRRQLRWLGHVSRMPWERTPRQMLSCWVPAPRLAGGQLMTFGRSAAKAMAYYNIDVDTWPALAANRAEWRAAIHGALLVANRPRRAAAAAADRAIDATLTEQRKAPRTAPLRDITNLPAALQ